MVSVKYNIHITIGFLSFVKPSYSIQLEQYKMIVFQNTKPGKSESWKLWIAHQTLPWQDHRCKTVLISYFKLSIFSILVNRSQFKRFAKILINLPSKQSLNINIEYQMNKRNMSERTNEWMNWLALIESLLLVSLV